MKKKRLYEDYDYEEEYNKELKKKSEYEDVIRNYKYSYMRKTIISGDVVESELYPIWKCRNDMPRERVGRTREAQKKLNDKNRRKKIVRLVNTNFGEEDLFLSLTYKDGDIPTEERAMKDIKNYIARLRRKRKKDGIKEPLKYVYEIAYDNDPESSKAVRIHHHIFINNMDRDVAEKLWGKGRANSKRLQKDDFGLEGISRYIAEQPRKKKDGEKQTRGKRFGYSTNLKKPIITCDRTTLSNRRVENIAMNENDYKEFYEDKYKDCEYLECTVYRSKIYSGIYMYAKLKKKSGDKKSERSTRAEMVI